MTAPRNRGWIWYFVVVGVLAAGAMVIPIVYNVRQQLTPEQLAANRQLWERRQPRDYDLRYTQKGSASGTFVVQVRDGKVVSVTMDGQPLESRQFGYHDMNAWFEFLEGFLEKDAQPGSRRAFNRAVFDPDDGHLMHFVRREMGTSYRLEVTLGLERLAGEESPGKKAAGP